MRHFHTLWVGADGDNSIMNLFRRFPARRPWSWPAPGTHAGTEIFQKGTVMDGSAPSFSRGKKLCDFCGAKPGNDGSGAVCQSSRRTGITTQSHDIPRRASVRTVLNCHDRQDQREAVLASGFPREQNLSFDKRPYITPRMTGISRSRIFLRSVLRLRPSMAAALI